MHMTAHVIYTTRIKQNSKSTSYGNGNEHQINCKDKKRNTEQSEEERDKEKKKGNDVRRMTCNKHPQWFPLTQVCDFHDLYFDAILVGLFAICDVLYGEI